MNTVLRYPVAALAGLVAALGLLWLMQTLTLGKGASMTRQDSLPLVSFVRTRQETETRVRERVLPEPPPEPDGIPLGVAAQGPVQLQLLARGAVVAPLDNGFRRPVTGSGSHREVEERFVATAGRAV